jgi:hypothetical protein
MIKKVQENHVFFGSVKAGEAGLGLNFDRKESPADPPKNRCGPV